MLTTIGRKTGEPRTVCLTYVPHNGDMVVVGSNWGQQQHPAWSANLLALPAADVLTDRERYRVAARYLSGSERDEVWKHVVDAWPDFETYEERASHRELRLFVLARKPA